MKKLWVALAMMLVLLCWGSSAMAYEDWCSNCGGVFEYTFVDMGDYHQVKCTNCGDSYEQPHYIDNYVEDQKYHYEMCSACGKTVITGTHHILCDVPDSCTGCWMTTADIPNMEYTFEHLGDAYISLDMEKHQYMCQGCREPKAEPEAHVLWCTNPDVCVICGMENDDLSHYIELQHTGAKYLTSSYSHKRVCDACGEDLDLNWESHTVLCTQPGVCTVCGGTDVLTSPDHSWQYVDQGNGTHLRKCADCGAKDRTSEHYRYCTDTGSGCSLCGAANVETVVHDYGYVDQGDGETHMEICVACGEEFGESQHFRFCTDYGSGCSLCGSDDVVYVYHWETYVDKGDGKHHTEICEECGETLNEYEHWVNCTEPGVCESCGSTNVGGVGILHPTASIKYVDLGKKHQQQCTDCGYKWAADWHWAYCNDTTTCRICKLTGLTLPSDQYTHRGTFTDLGASHRFTCNYCDYTTTESHWVYCTDQSECYQCGATGFEINWENRYCQGPITYLSYDATNHTFSCGACKQTYTEPHGFDDDGSCSCGYVKAAVGLPGDADNNSRVTLNDAIAILEGTVSNDANADVNGDGKTDLNDALRILQYLAGWNVSLQ